MKARFFTIPALVLLISIMLVGCAAKMGKVLGEGYLYQNAEMKLDDAKFATVEGKTDKTQALTDQALELFLQITEKGPENDYYAKAHYQVAEIYKSRFDWEKATQHYQAIIDAETLGYLASKARSEIANIRKNRQVIDDNRKIYINIPDEQKKDPKSDGYRKAGQALLMMAEAYENLGSNQEAINRYSELVDNFPEYPQAPQSQFNIGHIYFYKLYDYSDKGGWGAFVKVIEKFPDSFEAKQADTLLKKAEQTLTEIGQEQDYVLKFRKKKAVDFEETGRYITQQEKYSVFAEQVAQAYINIAKGWELGMRNYPYAIKAYQELVKELPMEKFVAADARYQIGRLHQQNGDYEKAINAYENLFKNAPESTWRDESVYNQAVCFDAISEYTESHKMFKAYMSLGKNMEFYRQAEQKVRQYEHDGDGDGYPFYKEREAGTEDNNPNDYPGAKKTAQR